MDSPVISYIQEYESSLRIVIKFGQHPTRSGVKFDWYDYSVRFYDSSLER